MLRAFAPMRSYYPKVDGDDTARLVHAEKEGLCFSTILPLGFWSSW